MPSLLDIHQIFFHMIWKNISKPQSKFGSHAFSESPNQKSKTQNPTSQKPWVLGETASLVWSQTMLTYIYIKLDIYFHDQMHPFNAEMTTKLYSERFIFRFKLLWLQVRQETKKCMQLFMGIFYQLCRPVSYFMSVWTISDSHGNTVV